MLGTESSPVRYVGLLHDVAEHVAAAEIVDHGRPVHSRAPKRTNTSVNGRGQRGVAIVYRNLSGSDKNDALLYGAVPARFDLRGCLRGDRPHCVLATS